MPLNESIFTSETLDYYNKYDYSNDNDYGPYGGGAFMYVSL